MSKKIIGIALVVVGIALQAIPGIGQAIGLPMIAAGISSAAVIGLGLVIAGSLLMAPKAPKLDAGSSQITRLTATLVPTEPRKIMFGITAGGNDVRYQAFTGTNQEYLDMIVCHASHAVNSITELWLDNEQAWTLAGGVLGRFVGYLNVTPITLGTNANGIAIDSTWTTSCTLTGCAYSHVRFKLTGNSDKVSSPFASGVTSRTTWRGKGAKVYDPRLDGTVPGGSGTQRANDQTTWAWDDNASRNPALQELFYELGWQIGGKLAVGKGVPPARIDLASYAVAANACDESVTLNGGGTESRYRSDCVVSEGEDPQGVRNAFCAAINAVLRDAGGKLSLTVMHNDLGTPVAPSGRSAFDQYDVQGEMQWEQTPDLNSSFNIVRGRRIDPSDAALYQPVDFPEVALTSPDGIDRIDTVDYGFVQSNGQAQRLAKQRLQRNQYQGKLSFAGQPSFWGVSVGDVFAFTHPAFGWTGKLFRVALQKINRTGTTELVAIEENAAVYAWANNESAAVTPGTPTVYDPANHPLVQGIIVAAASVVGPGSGNVLYDNTGVTFQSADDLNYKVQGSSGTITSGVTMSYKVKSGTFNGFTSASGAQTMTVTSGAATITPTALTTATGQIEITAVYNGLSLPAFTTTLTRTFAAATPAGTGGGGGGSTDVASQSSGYTLINTATFTTITSSLMFTLPTGKTTLRAVVNLSCKYPNTANQSGPWHVEFKVQRGGVDQGSTQGSNPDPDITTDGSLKYSEPGTMQYTLDMASLTSGTQYTVVVQARVASGTLPTNGVGMNFSGTVTLSAP